MRTSIHLSALCVVLTIILAQDCQAALVIGGTNELPVIADQRVIIPVGSPLHPGGENDIDLGVVSARGAWTFERQQQVGDTIEFVDGSFFGRGELEGFGEFSLVGGQPFGFDPIMATLSNVVQDPDDPGYASGDPSSIISGDLFINVPDYGIRFDDGPNLEVRDPFAFTSEFDGLPPSPGTLYVSDPFDQELEAYLEGTDDVAAISTNRILTAVPEPSSGGLFGLLAMVGIVRCRGRYGASRLGISGSR